MKSRLECAGSTVRLASSTAGFIDAVSHSHDHRTNRDEKGGGYTLSSHGKAAFHADHLFADRQGELLRARTITREDA